MKITSSTLGRARALTVALLFTAALGAGCGNSNPQYVYTGGPAPTASPVAPSLARIEVTPDVAQLLAGETVTLTVRGFDQNNNPFALAAADTTIVSNTPAVATVSGSVVTAVAVGNATITVTSVARPAISDTAQISVVSGNNSGFQTSDGFTTGSVNGQNGWTVLNANLDQEIVTTSDFRTGDAFSVFGAQALRISNAQASSDFGTQIYAPLGNDSVGQANAVVPAPFVEGTRYNRYEASFDFATTVDTLQDGLRVTLSPDPGNGDRMSYIAIRDSATDGLNIQFADTNNIGNFVYTTIADNLDRTVPHNVQLVFTAVDGPDTLDSGTTVGNDIVQVFLDGELIHTGTSWETYWYFNPEPETSNPPKLPRVVKTMLIRLNTAAAALDGQGILIGNFRQTFSDVTL